MVCVPMRTLANDPSPRQGPNTYCPTFFRRSGSASLGSRDIVTTNDVRDLSDVTEDKLPQTSGRKKFWIAGWSWKFQLSTSFPGFTTVRTDSPELQTWSSDVTEGNGRKMLRIEEWSWKSSKSEFNSLLFHDTQQLPARNHEATFYQTTSLRLILTSNVDGMS